MNQSSSTPPPAPAHIELDDPEPLYLDEEPEIQNDDVPRAVSAAPSRRQPSRIPRPIRRFEDD